MSFIERAASHYAETLSQSTLAERAFRQKAWARFEGSSLALANSAIWKKEGLAAIGNGQWVASLARPQELLPETKALCERYGNQFEIIVLINGIAVEGSSLAKPFSFLADYKADEGLASLAVAVGQAGLRLQVAKGEQQQRPLLLIHQLSGGSDEWSSVFHDIDVATGATLKVAEVFVSAKEHCKSLYMETTRIRLAEKAHCHWVRLERESPGYHFYSHMQVEAKKEAAMHFTQAAAGATWSRTDFGADIIGEGAEVHVGGLCFGRDRRQLDERIQLRHLAPNSSSSQLFKGLYKDQSRGAILGKIYIAKDAQKVSSSQLNQSLLLSKNAEAITQPELEIYADDVKANHGATIGRLEEEKIFYLESRGIAPETARHLLARAFISDVFMKIQDPELRQWAEQSIEDLLPDFLTELSHDS